MGCGGSKEVPNLENNNSVRVEVKSTFGDQENAAKRDDDNLMESNSIDSPSPLALTPDVNVKNNAVKLRDDSDGNNTGPAEKARESLIDSSFDEWSDHQPRQSHTIVPGKHNDKLLNMEFEVDSAEYGKDGIDLTSTSFVMANPPEVLDHGIQLEVTKRLTKKHSEEPFDPSFLVDIDKFKAVNAPKQNKKTPDKEKTVAMDPKQERKQSLSNRQVPKASPTNYNEYYDEDEKALMESIEHDYVGTAYTTLPGAVM